MGTANRRRARQTNRIRHLADTAIKAIKGLPHKLASKLSEITVEKRDIYRALIALGLTVFFALAETTFFSTFRLFGASPDLMLPLVIAIGMSEGATWGGAFGIIAGLVISALGSTGMTADPIIFCLAGFFAGLLLEEYFSESLPVRGLMIVSGALLRAFVSLVTATGMPRFVVSDVVRLMILPELGATLILSALPHAAAYFSLKWAHRSRSERTR